MGSLTTFLVANEEIWSVGSMALQVGEQLEEQLGGWGPARTKRKAAVNKVSQDTGPGQPCEVGGDSLLARSTEMLERLPGHTVNIGMNFSRIFGMKRGGNNSSLVPGSQASPGVDKEKKDGESLVFRIEKKCLNLLHKNLVEASPKNKANSGKKFVTCSTLGDSLKDYTGDLTMMLC